MTAGQVGRAGGVGRQDRADGFRLEVGQSVDGHLAVLVVEQDGHAAVLRAGPHVDACGIDQPCADAQPGGRVVIAAGDDDPRARVTQAHERVVVQPHRVDRRHGAVEDVAGDQDRVHPLRAHRLDERVQEARLGRAQVSAVQGPAQVPVGGVQQAHPRTVGGPTDKTAPRRRRPGACLPPCAAA